VRGPRASGEPRVERCWSGILPLAEAVPRAFPDLAPYIEHWVERFGELPLREPNPGAPGGRRVLVEILDLDATGAANDGGGSSLPEPCPEYWVPPSPGVHPGVELVHRLRQSKLYEPMCKGDCGQWEPMPIALFAEHSIDYFGSRRGFLQLGIRVRPIADTEHRPASLQLIREALTAEYDEAEAQKQKPPNVKEVAARVQTRLAAKGYTASKSQIQKIAAETNFSSRRLLQGHRFKIIGL
jgi:hypothetical protein